MGLEQTGWKETAIRLIPECEARLADADTPYLLWFELWELFRSAYREPRNESLIGRIYQFAGWCEMAPDGETADDDLFPCVAVCFYEEIPTCDGAREDMPNWFTKEDFPGMRDIFRHKFTEEQYAKIETALLARKFRAHSFGSETDRAV